ncbi:Transposase domain [Alkalithermobacter thermoalcaliphilus JW-YL-7 = DSM 7308]|uniref:Transposase IS4 family protein n=1 Tax=Alkalithermobacter thermoalcaliphilus JW-YL-7 = DSM 7308 TaxID=1121328 RepID=A0A150FQW8_CLOPD|nr:transposase IS4 family protein [[Clostridium] paradoxum JW-YL-7 = DSM 7308]SHL29497.1 Transposase domain [[Clostridium] paradoxum JW-YL-7 = DSM 7308]
MYQRQEIFNIIELFTSQKLINFYTKIFDNLDLSILPDKIPSKYGPNGYSRHALFRAFIVMKCEKFAKITDLKDFLENNLIIAQLCGFNILKSLPSYSVFQRFIKKLSNSYLKEIMKNQVNILKELGFIDNNFISVDATPVKANTKFNNPKCFANNKFSKNNHPSSDKDCKLGVHTANNSMNVQVLEDKPNNSKKKR